MDSHISFHTDAPLFTVQAKWDPEAGVWWAQSEDIPGLNAEAETMDELVTEVRELVPVLLAENKGIRAGVIRVSISSERTEEVQGA